MQEPIIRLDPSRFDDDCCEAPARELRRCPSCATVWASCIACETRYEWVGWGFGPVPEDGPRTCRACGRTVPPRYASQLHVCNRRDVPRPLRTWVFDPELEDEPAARPDRRIAIKFVDLKQEGVRPRITQVQLSKSRRSVYWSGRTFAVTGKGYKFNHIEVETRRGVWISGPRRDGLDTLYPGVVEVDAGVRETYWVDIRQQPDRVDQASYRSPGLYTKRGRGKKD